MNVKRIFAPLLLFIPIIFFFWPLLFHGRLPFPADTLPGLYHPFRDAFTSSYPQGVPFQNFLITDSLRQQLPWRQFCISQLQAGQIPWWNPYNFAGTPHLANFQSACFYPLNLFFWFTSFLNAWNALVVGQMILGSLALYAFLRHHKLSQSSCLLGAITFIFSGFFIAWLEWNTAVHVAAWSPVILLSLDHLTRRFSFKWSLLLLVALVSQALAGYPQPWIYLSLLQGSYFLYLAFTQGKFKTSFLIILIYLIFLAIISPQLISTWQFSLASNRLADQGDLLTKPDWFLPFPQLLQLIVPDFFGNPATLNYWGVFNYTEFVSFIGIIPAYFALNSLINKTPKSRIFFFGFFAALSLLLATKNPISTLQFSLQLPLIGSSQPSRWLVITNLSLSILAAYGFDKFLSRKRLSPIPLILLWLVMLTTWLVAFKPQILSWQPLLENQIVARRNLILPQVELIVLTLSALFIWLATRKFSFLKSVPLQTPSQRSALVIAGVVLLLTSSASAVRFGSKFTPFTESKFFYPRTNTILYLQQNQGLYRYMTNHAQLMPANVNLYYGLPTIEGYDPLYLKEYARLLYATETDDFPSQSKAYNRILTTPAFDSPLIDILGVRYLFSLEPIQDPTWSLVMQEGKTLLYENLEVYPRVFLAPTTEIEKLTLNTITPAKIIEYQPNLVRVQYSTTDSNLLILTDSYYPHWQAHIDTQPLEIINWYGLRATIVPEGNHEVIFEYSHPQLQRLGFAQETPPFRR